MTGDSVEPAAGGSNVRIRRATEDDLPSALAVWWRCDHGVDAEVPTGPASLRTLRHELATGSMAVAEAGDGEVVGFAGVVIRGGVTMVADLFVDPRRHGEGIGGRLLDDVLADRWPRQTFSSAHRAALPLYIRAGMAPRWLALYLRGDPAALPSAAAGSEAVEATPAELARLERSWSGPDREEDHVAYWGAARNVVPLAVRIGGRDVGFAYVAVVGYGEPAWEITSMSVAPSVDPSGSVAALGAVLRCAAERGIASLGIVLAGHHPATIALLRSGWLIEDRDIYVASEPGLLDPERRLPDSTFA